MNLLVFFSSQNAQRRRAVVSRLGRVLLLSLLVASVAPAWAQTFAQTMGMQRIVLLPFGASGSAEVYSAGLPTAVQRSLNVVDNIYVPPIGDVLLVTERLQLEDNLSVEAIAEAYSASAVVSGWITVNGNQVEVTLGLAGPRFESPRDVVLRGNLDQPAQLVAQTVNSLVRELELRVSGEDRQQLDSVISQTPSLPSLRAVAQAAVGLRVPPIAELEAAVQLDSGSSWVLAEYARALALRGDQANALDYSLRALQASPADIEALIIRSIILLASGDSATATQGFDAALLLNPTHATALHAKGRLASDASQARGNFEAALRSNPRLSEAYVDLAALQRQGGDQQQALLTLRTGTSRVPDSTSLHRAVMQEAIRLGDPGGAYSYLNDFLTANPNAPATIYALATLLPGDNYRDVALAIVRNGRRRHNNSSVLAVAEADILLQGNDLAGAESALREAFIQNPNDPVLANQLALLLADQGRTTEAQQTMARLGDTPRVRADLAEIYIQAGQNGAAAEILETLLRDMPDDAELHALYGVALGRLGRSDQALNALDRALELAPGFVYAERARNIIMQSQGLGQETAAPATGMLATGVLSAEASSAFQTGLAALESGQIDEAIVALEQALAAQDDSAIAFYLGYALQLSGRTREAVGYYEQALQGMQDNATVLNNLGFAYYLLGRYDRAIDYLGQAIALDPDNGEAQLNYGLVSYDLRRYGRAVAPLERALSLNPELAERRIDTGRGEVLTLQELVEQARELSANAP